jgi:chemotaxis protein methyltransferase CheR
MLLQERYGPDPRVLVGGVDIDAEVIRAAQLGRYGKHAFRGVDEEFKARHFQPAGGLLQVREPLRGRVEFAVENLHGDFRSPLMGRADIILYRNVSIYFPGHVQRKVFTRLAELLDTGGYLVVGATETLFHDLGVLSLVQREGLYLFRKVPAAPVQAHPAQPREPRIPAAPKPQRPPARLASRPAAQPHPGPAAPPRPEPAAEPLRKPAAEPRRTLEEALDLARGGRLEEALARVENIPPGDPRFQEACTLRGSILLEGSRPREAAAACEQALALDALRPEATLMLGVIARNQGDPDLALKRFREAIYLDADCWLAHYYLADLLSAQGSWRRARNHFQQVMRLLDPGGASPAGASWFPLTFNAADFLAICRHKLASLDGKE